MLASSVLYQGGLLAGFLLAGHLVPRERHALITRDTVVNVVTGAGLFGVRLAVAWPLSRLSMGLVDASAWPVWAQVAVAFFALDFARYWLHRAHHRVPWLWVFHRVHHSTQRLDATAGLRMHVVDLVQLTLVPVLLFSVLLDTSRWHGWVLPVVLGVGAAADAFQHANLRWDPRHPIGRVWGLVFNNPHFHAWHHTADGRVDGNYGNTLVIWDRLFGSDVTREVLPEVYGLSADQALDTGVVALQLLRRR